MADIDSTSDAVRRLVTLVVDNGLAELTLEHNDRTITVRGLAESEKMRLAEVQGTVAQEPAVSYIPISDQVSAAPPPLPSNVIALVSPMVGIFYRSPSPEDPPFINVGDRVSIGQTVGLIEAMKVYSEIPAEASGRVVEILGMDGSLVQQGQTLYSLEHS